VAKEMAGAAAATGDVGLQAHAVVIGLWIRVFIDPEGWAAEAEREAHRAIETFGRLGDERGLARAWSLLGLAGNLNSRFAPAQEAWSRAVEHAERAGNRREALEGLAWVAVTAWAGPTPARQGVRRCREVFERTQGDRKAMATALFSQAGLLADLGRFEDARELFRSARGLLEEVALPVWTAGGLSQVVGWGLLLEGRPAEAEEELRRGLDTLRALGEVNFLSTVAGILAEAVCAQGRVDEAEGLTHVSQEHAGAEDVYTQVLWRSVRSKCLAQQGRRAEALQLARELADLIASTDSLDLRWHAQMSRAEVLGLAGLTAAAERALQDAIRYAEDKENRVAAQRAGEALQALAARQSAGAP